MNPDTGHLLEITEEVDLKKLLDEGYQELPPELEEEAKRELGKRNETYIDLESSSPLAQWAADQRRRKAKRKARNRRLRKEARRRRG